MNRKRLIPAIFSALVLAWAAGAVAQELTAEESSRLAGFEAGISSASPSAARDFMDDADLLGKLALIAPDRAAGIKGKASAIIDFEKLLDANWPASRERALSSSLALRLTPDGALAKVGLAPEPEKTLDWAAKYKTYSGEKTDLIGRAVKKWDIIFNGFTFNPNSRGWIVYNSTGAYFTVIGKNDVIFQTSVAGMKNLWGEMTLKERNDYLAKKAGDMLIATMDSSTTTAAGFQKKLSEAAIFGYLDASGRGRLDRYLSQMKTAEEVKVKLSEAQATSLKDLPVEQQMLLLGNMFDKHNVKNGAVELERQVDANRPSRAGKLPRPNGPSLPDETLSFQNNALLAGMLRTSLVKEVKGTSPGDKVAAFYSGGAKLDIAIKSCQGCYAKYEPSTGQIVVDSELVQQYMRVNNVSADALVKDKAKLAALSKYVAPVFVHEATHQIQHSWAARAGIYKPYTQEDEIESNTMEALFTSQKRDSDPKFKSMFLTMDKASAYARQRVELSKSFEKNQKEFGVTVRQQYYSGVPSLEAASSQILSAVSTELARRKNMGAAELSGLDNSAKDMSEVSRMSAQEIAGSTGDIKTLALRKIQDDLLHNNLYDEHYAGAEDWAASVLKSGYQAKKRAVPAL